MPSSHRQALKQLLETIDQHLKQAEARLLTPLRDDERHKLIDNLVELQVRRESIKSALMSEDVIV
jgi:hypothetical protein